MINRWLTTFKKHFQKNDGYSLLELIMASAVGSIVIAGVFVSYGLISKHYNRIVSIHEVQEAGLPSIRLIERHIRMAGFKALDNNLDAPLGAISLPIKITDSGNACCDAIEIIYDLDTSTRQRIAFFVDKRNNPTRNALFMDIDLWNSSTSSWDSNVADALVADYIDDMQFVASDLNNDSQPQIIDASLIFRSRNAGTVERGYSKPSYNPGNYSFSATDSYHRDEFSATIFIRNLRD